MLSPYKLLLLLCAVQRWGCFYLSPCKNNGLSSAPPTPHLFPSLQFVFYNSSIQCWNQFSPLLIQNETLQSRVYSRHWNLSLGLYLVLSHRKQISFHARPCGLSWQLSNISDATGPSGPRKLSLSLLKGLCRYYNWNGKDTPLVAKLFYTAQHYSEHCWRRGAKVQSYL